MRRPAPSGTTPSSGRPVTAGRSMRLHRAARSGSVGQAPITIPTQLRLRVRSASTVSAVWLRVPRPAPATTSTEADKAAATSASVPPLSSRGTSNPPLPSTSTRSCSAASSRATDAVVAVVTGAKPARRAARAGASGSGKRDSSRHVTEGPARRRTSSMSPSCAASTPVWAGLSTATRWPAATAIAAIADVTVVLPTPVEVPVTTSTVI